MVNEQAYLDFCRAKENPLERFGFEVLKRDLHGSTFDHQADTIQWALRIGLFDWLERQGEKVQ